MMVTALIADAPRTPHKAGLCSSALAIVLAGFSDRSVTPAFGLERRVTPPIAPARDGRRQVHGSSEPARGYAQPPTLRCAAWSSGLAICGPGGKVSTSPGRTRWCGLAVSTELIRILRRPARSAASARVLKKRACQSHLSSRRPSSAARSGAGGAARSSAQAKPAQRSERGCVGRALRPGGRCSGKAAQGVGHSLPPASRA